VGASPLGPVRDILHCSQTLEFGNPFAVGKKEIKRNRRERKKGRKSNGETCGDLRPTEPPTSVRFVGGEKLGV